MPALGALWRALAAARTGYANRSSVVKALFWFAGFPALLAAAAGAVIAALIVVVMIAMWQSQQDDGCAPNPTGSTPDTKYVSTDPSQAALDEIPSHYLSEYQEAGEKYGLDWAFVAAIGWQETQHGAGGERNTCVNSFAGAQGPMQFMPATWESQRQDGNGDGEKDVCYYEDAIHGAAYYLRNLGAPEDYHGAACGYYGACADQHADYANEVMATYERYKAASAEEERVAVLGVDRPLAAATGLGTGLRGLAASTLEMPVAGAEMDYDGEWDLVDDANKRVAYTEYTSYDSELNHGISAWNELGTISFEPGGSDMTVVDEDLSGDTVGHTSTNGNVTLDPYWFDSATTNAREAVVAHELGHVLGLMHQNSEPSVMKTPACRNCNDNYNVPTDYDERVYYELWGQPSGGSGGGTPVNNPEGGVEGNTKAVFPLPEEHFDSYTNDWGAARPGTTGSHEGTDLMVPRDTPIFSITDGTVVSSAGSSGSGWNEFGGYTVMVEAAYDIGPIRAGDKLYYAHMEQPTELSPGDQVKAGDTIGYVGDTGQGPEGTRGKFETHLHLGWYVDAARADSTKGTGAKNPYDLLEWLKQNGGVATGNGQGLDPVACDPTGESAGPAGGGNQDPQALLDNPNFVPGSQNVVDDLENGNVDPRVIGMLNTLVAKHKIEVSVFGTGHPYGEIIPAGAPGAGSLNTHGTKPARAADISGVDGKPVQGNGMDADVLDVGRMLHGISPECRPDEIIGPTDWTAELGYPREDGWISDGGLTGAHSDHIHAGYQLEDGTENAGASGSCEEAPKNGDPNAPDSGDPDPPTEECNPPGDPKGNGNVGRYGPDGPDGNRPEVGPLTPESCGDVDTLRRAAEANGFPRSWADEPGIWTILDRESGSTREALYCVALNPMPSGGDPAGGSTSGDGSYVFGFFQGEGQTYETYGYPGGYDAAVAHPNCFLQAEVFWKYIDARYGSPAAAADHYQSNGYY